MGKYSGTIYGDNLSITFEKDNAASVEINGGAYTATVLTKGDIIEVWQERKTPPYYLKKGADDTLILLQSSDLSESELLLKKIQEE